MKLLFSPILDCQKIRCLILNKRWFSITFKLTIFCQTQTLAKSFFHDWKILIKRSKTGLIYLITQLRLSSFISCYKYQELNLRNYEVLFRRKMNSMYFLLMIKIINSQTLFYFKILFWQSCFVLNLMPSPQISAKESFVEDPPDRFRSKTRLPKFGKELG